MKKIEFNTSEIHHFFLWIYNWTEEDFQIAFKNSDLGWQYQWNKFQGNLTGNKCSSSAIIETVLNMDNKHQKMLFDYILNVKYRNSIDNMEKNRIFFEQWKPQNTENENI